MKRLIITLLGIATGVAAAFADKVSDYKEYAAKVRAEVWADSLPEFSAPASVPEKYKGEPAVILAVHKDISAKKKTGVGFDKDASLIPIKKVAKIDMDDYERTLVLIQDKAALEEFSEYDLPVKAGGGDWFTQRKDERKYVLGVRIIKPDGRVIEVPTDDFVIMSQQKKEDKADRQKLAVPGLETGDRLDIFLFTHTDLKNIQPEPIDIVMRDRYPVLAYTLRCKIDDDLTTIYRQRNGAPDLDVVQGPDKDFIITSSLAQAVDAEPKYMYDSKLQSPYIEMLIYNRRFDDYPAKFARKDGVMPNPDSKTTILKDYESVIDGFKKDTQSLSAQLNSFKGKPLKTVKEKYKSGAWTKAQTADYLYNLLVFSYMTGKYKYYPGDFVKEFYSALQSVDIKDARMGLAVARQDGDVDSVINANNIWYCVYLPDTGQYFSNAFRGYNTSSEVLASHQGKKILLGHDKNLSKKEREAEDRWIDMPQDPAHANRVVSTVDAVADGTDLRISLRTDAFGAAKNRVGPLLTSDDMLQAYLAYLNRDGVTVDPQMLRKEKSKDKAQRLERNSDEARKQADEVREAVADYHGLQPKQFMGCEILSGGIGVCPDSAAISYQADYVVDGLLKPAGRNLILSVGNLIGEQSEIEPSQRKRQAGDDILLPYPREIVADITVALPSGYTPSAAALARLNTEVKNSAGHFASTAAVDGGKLHLAVSYVLDFKRLPASAWPDVLALTDAATRFNALTLLLEKK